MAKKPPSREPCGAGIAPQHYESEGMAFLVVCSDGSVWKWDPWEEAWAEQPPIPGTARAVGA